MRIHSLLVLLSTPLPGATGFLSPQRNVPQAPRILTRVNVVEKLTEVNTSFKKGLKYVLVPNAKDKSASIPSPFNKDDAPYSSSLLKEGSSVQGWPSDASSAVIPEAVPDEIPIVTSPAVSDPAMPKFEIPDASSIDMPRLEIPKPMLSSIPEKDSASEYVESAVDVLRENYRNNLGKFVDSPRSPGSAPSLFDYLKEKDWEALKWKPGSFRMDGYPFVPADKIHASLENVKALTQSNSRWTIPDLAAAANWDELGGWYVVSAGLLSLLILSATTDVTKDEAEVAVKNTLAESSVAISSSTASQDKMQEQVEKLTKATEKVMKELSKLKAEKAARDYELATMKSDVRMLQTRVDASERSEMVLKKQLEKAQTTISSQTAEVTELKAEKNTLRKELEKALTEAESLKAQLPDADQSSPAEDEAKVEAKVKAKVEEPVVIEPKKAARKKTGRKNTAPQKTAPHKTAPTRTASKKAASIKGAKKSTAPAQSPVETESDLPFYSTIEELTDDVVAEKVVAKNGATKAKKSSKKIAKKTKSSKEASKVEELKVEDWSKLSASTLKRKTVKDLTEYLETKGETATDGDGKPFKKADLVETVLSLK